MTDRQFRKIIENLKIGESIYINSINLSINQIDYLRMAIRYRVLKPDMDELRKAIKPEFISAFLDGTSICPQMTYFKDSFNYWYDEK